MIPPFRKVKSASPDLNRAQDAVDDVLRAIAACPLLDGVLLTDLDISSTVNTAVNHGLQRQPRGWIITDMPAFAAFYRVAWDERSITLLASVDSTVSIWVF
jgi:hypothetical protein